MVPSMMIFVAAQLFVTMFTVDGACDETKDYFPVKVNSQTDINWDVKYFNTYKEVKYYQSANRNQPEVTYKYVLVQEGCDRPTVDGDGLRYDYTQFKNISVPIKSAVLATSELTYLEILNERDSVQGLQGVYTSSPCVNKQIVEGKILNVNSFGGVSCKSIDPAVTFHYGAFGGTSCDVNTTNIYVGNIYEEKLIQQLEWVKYFALFYNKEEAVGTYVVETESAMSCIQSTVSTHVATRLQQGISPSRKNVLWATPMYADNANTWSTIGTCPNYYCDAVIRAGGNIVNDLAEVKALSQQVKNENGNQITAIDGANNQTVTLTTAHSYVNGSMVMFYKNSFQAEILYVKNFGEKTLELADKDGGLVSFGTCKTGGAFGGAPFADCKINKPVTSADLLSAGVSIDLVMAAPLYSFSEATVQTCKTFWNSLPSTWNAMRTKSVYDYGGGVLPNGGLDWFASRYALPDVVVEDMANILYPELKLKGDKPNRWYQNVFTEGACQNEVPPSPENITIAQQALADQCTNPLVTFTSSRNTYCNDNSSSSKEPLETYAVALIVVAVILGVAIITGGLIMYRSHLTIKGLYGRLREQDAKIDPSAMTGLSAPLTTGDNI
mmetsp:Transcript_36108/g.34157  ORF Transcript_36108/g.34157 Transcript_36108/m.34157 type:complete len:610 (-) Transcript_36108:434-2263(-)